MDSLFWALIGMIVTFLGIYIFISRKFDQSEISDQFGHKRKFSAKYNMAKKGLLILRQKNSIIKTFKELPEKDKKEVLDKLQELNS